jgi:cell division protein FtsL
MTTIAAPGRRTSSTRVAPSARAAKKAPRASTRVRTERHHLTRHATLLVLFTVFALVSAVVFHVVLAQHQLQLDRLNAQINQEQRRYEQRRLTASLLASPPRIIQEAQRLGLVVPDDPPQYLYVPDAPMPQYDDGSTADTIANWSKTKPSLGPQQP